MHQGAIRRAVLLKNAFLKQGYVAQVLGNSSSEHLLCKSAVSRRPLSSYTHPTASLSGRNILGNKLRCNFASLSRSMHLGSLLNSKDDSGKDGKDAPASNTPEAASDMKQSNILGSMFTQDAAAAENKLNDPNFKEGDEEKKEEPKEETPFEKSQRYAKWMLIISASISIPVFIIDHGRPQKNEEGDVVEDQYSVHIAPIAYVKRAWGELMSVKREFIEPSSKKLLPDPVKEPYYQPPYTLVMELMDVFLHPVYDSVTGWRFKKRPGIDYFFSQVGPPMYEIVIFTKELGMTAFPLIESMDPKGYVMYRLFRDSARYKVGFDKGDVMNGEMPKLDPYYQKDLRYLNRDLSKVIMIDCDKRAFEKNPDNGLCIPEWDGSSQDSTLYDLASFLRAIAVSNVGDVRDVVRHYNKNDDVIGAFKEAQKRMEDDEKFMQKYQKENPPQLNILSGAGKGLTSWFKR